MKKIAGGVLYLLCLAMVVGSLLYVFSDPATFSEPFKNKYTRHLFMVRSHGALAALALLMGSLNLTFKGASHRWIGRLYMVGIVGGSLTGLPMSLMAEGGYSGRTAFTIISVLWLFTGLKAWQSAVQKNFSEHKVWVIRNFALTFGAVIFRFTLHGLQQYGYDFPQIYASTVWLSWGLAIAAGEWSLRNFSVSKVSTI